MNNQNNKIALFYFRDKQCQAVSKFTFGNRGYEVHNVETIEEMLEQAGKGNYSFILMDDRNIKSNVKYPGSLDINGALRVYNSVKERVEKGKIKFMFLSHFPRVVNRAKKAGIPAMKKDEFDGSIDDIVGKRIPW